MSVNLSLGCGMRLRRWLLRGEAARGSKEEAVNKAWEKYCKAGYCEGYSGQIVGRTNDTLTVSINNNTRYIWYVVSGEPGNYAVYMNKKCDHGKIDKTSC